tara:strand:+ start:2361 stop:2762 length:402 start_codon:yes stop_codon:yes gene_type:complete
MKTKLKFCNGCEQQKVIFKNKMIDGVRHQLCANCAKQYHKQLKVTTKQIKKRSDKKVMQDRLYTVLRNKFMLQHPNCQINTAHCTTVGTEIHHTAYRTGDNYLDTKTWLNACRSCHNWCHANPKEARELGLLK